MIKRAVELMMKRIVQKRMREMLAPRESQPDYEPMRLLLPPSDEPSVAKRVLAQLTEEEKISLLSGVDEFCIPGVPRLGLKRVWSSDATLGLRNWKTDVTDFPASSALASSFDRELLGRVGAVLGEECRALGVGVLLGPGVNLARVPVCGRNFEYFGEDPYLSGEMAAAYIKGVTTYPVITCVKHFACNNSEYDRHKSNSVVDERTLRELYLPAFKRSIEAGSLALMTSYNQVNGTYTSEHPYLLEGLLRGEWGFDTLVVSDWNSLYSTEGVLAHGVDLEMPGPRYLAKEQVQSCLQAGTARQSMIDEKVLHLLTTYEKAGLFSVPMADRKCKAATTGHRDIALEAACASVVLLKNEGALLPLAKEARLCIGGSLIGKASQGGGSSMVALQAGVPTLASVLEGHAERLPRFWYCNPTWRRKVAQADAVVLQVGFDHIEESEAYDKPWQLLASDKASIHQAAKLNAKTVVIVQSGGAVGMESWHAAVPAIFLSSFLGSSTAQALKALLFGEANPSGKLCHTLAHSLDEYRSMRTYPTDFAHLSLDRLRKGQGDPAVRSVGNLEYSEALMMGYRQFDTEKLQPLFCFGHGLSYTHFLYEDLECDAAPDGWKLSFSVCNGTERAGSEVCQLYVRPLEPKVFRPMQELKGFVKVHLGPQEMKRVSLDVPFSALERWDLERWAFVSDEGQYELCIGSSSRDIRLQCMAAYEKRKPEV